MEGLVKFNSLVLIGLLFTVSAKDTFPKSKDRGKSMHFKVNKHGTLLPIKKNHELFEFNDSKSYNIHLLQGVTSNEEAPYKKQKPHEDSHFYHKMGGHGHYHFEYLQSFNDIDQAPLADREFIKHLRKSNEVNQHHHHRKGNLFRYVLNNQLPQNKKKVAFANKKITDRRRFFIENNDKFKFYRPNQENFEIKPNDRYHVHFYNFGNVIGRNPNENQLDMENLIGGALAKRRTQNYFHGNKYLNSSRFNGHRKNSTLGDEASSDRRFNFPGKEYMIADPFISWNSRSTEARRSMEARNYLTGQTDQDNQQILRRHKRPLFRQVYTKRVT